MFDANNGKCESSRSASAWKQLMWCHQNDGEDLIDCHRKFAGPIEAVELAFGDTQPNGKDQDKERSKFIAFFFMDGADKKLCGLSLKDLETDHSLGKKHGHPSGIEAALQVLTSCSENNFKRRKNEPQWSNLLL